MPCQLESSNGICSPEVPLFDVDEYVSSITLK